MGDRRLSKKFWAASVFLLPLAGCADQLSAADAAGPDTQRLFVESDKPPVTSDRASTGGVSFADFDGDGDADLIITNGYDVSTGDPVAQENKFYENTNGQYAAVSLAGLSELALYGSGSAWADYDNDGDLDAFFANQRDQANTFVLQDSDPEGGRRFKSLNETLLGEDKGWSYSVAAADADNDGFVDVYVSNGGLSHSGVNFLYRNDQGEGLVKVSEQIPATQDQPSGGAAWADYDNDGDQDLLVANRGTTDLSIQRLALYRNDGDFNFVRVDNDVLPADAEAPMSVAWADVDSDGDLDFYAANLYGVANKLYENNGAGGFVLKDGGAATTDPGHSYSTTFGDLDNDGDLDLVVANWGAASMIYLNDGDGVFSRMAQEQYAQTIHYTAALALGDTDLDGDLDIIVANWPNGPGADEENKLIENRFADGKFLRVALEGVNANRSAIGARLELRYRQDGEDKLQVREVNTQSGWRSQSELVQHFGLGATPTEDMRLTVRWPGGATENWEIDGAQPYIMVSEGNPAVTAVSRR